MGFENVHMGQIHVALAIVGPGGGALAGLSCLVGLDCWGDCPLAGKDNLLDETGVSVTFGEDFKKPA